MSPIDRFHHESGVLPMEQTNHVHVRDVSRKSRIQSKGSKSEDKKRGSESDVRTCISQHHHNMYACDIQCNN